MRPCLCPRIPGTGSRCALLGCERGRRTIPDIRGTHLPRGRAACATRYTSSAFQLSSFASLIKNELAAAVGSDVGSVPAFIARMSSVARKRAPTSRPSPLMVHWAISFVVFIPVAPPRRAWRLLLPVVSQRVHRTVSPSRGSAIPRTSLLRPARRPHFTASQLADFGVRLRTSGGENEGHPGASQRTTR